MVCDSDVLGGNFGWRWKSGERVVVVLWREGEAKRMMERGGEGGRMVCFCVF